jgi:hypothetical protein
MGALSTDRWVLLIEAYYNDQSNVNHTLSIVSDTLHSTALRVV